jgi:hypothetical protein
VAGGGASGEEGGGGASGRRREGFHRETFYTHAVKRKGRSGFDVRHDWTDGKIGFTWRRVVGAPYIRLDACLAHCIAS